MLGFTRRRESKRSQAITENITQHIFRRRASDAVSWAGTNSAPVVGIANNCRIPEEMSSEEEARGSDERFAAITGADNVKR